MSGPTSSVPNGCSPNPVTCTSTWLCDPELSSVLNVWYSEDAYKKEKEITRERCVCLESAQPAEAGNPCSLVFSCVTQVKTRILSLRICSQARTIEVYTLSPNGEEEEYLGTSRGEKLHTFAGAENDSPVTMYSTHLQLDFPVPSCKVKLLSLGNKQHVFVSEVSVQVTLVPEKCTPAPSVLGSSINLDRVQSIMDSMGGKMSPGAEQLMSMVRAQQKHQIPFGAHLLQLFGGIDHGLAKVQKSEEESKTPSATNVPSVKHEASSKQEQDSQPPLEPRTTSLHAAPPNSDLTSSISSLLQHQASTIRDGLISDSPLPFLQNLSLEKNQCLPVPGVSRQTNHEAMEKEIGAMLERLISAQMERMERTLLQHIDHKMKILQERLDARLDQFIHVLQNSRNVSSGRAGEKPVNGEGDLNGEHNGDCSMLSKQYIPDMSALS